MPRGPIGAVRFTSESAAAMLDRRGDRWGGPVHWRAEARPVKLTCPNCRSRARWPECPHCGYSLISRHWEIASWCAFILAVTVIVVLMLRAALR